MKTKLIVIEAILQQIVVKTTLYSLSRISEGYRNQQSTIRAVNKIRGLDYTA